MGMEIWDSAVGIATGYGLDNQGSEFVSWWEQEFSLLHVIQTGSGSHTASYPMGNGGSFSVGKAAGSVRLTTLLQLVQGQAKVGLYIHSPICFHSVVLN
jgi:hypothetical protein